MARSKGKVIAENAYKTKSSKIAGRGGFATRAIKKGERLMEYLGERVSHAVADSRFDDAKYALHHTFLFAVNRSVVIDAAVNGNDARFLNHSCAPNCEALIEKSRVFIEAIRDIATGEEVTFDYATCLTASFGDMDCLCGAANCRGRSPIRTATSASS